MATQTLTENFVKSNRAGMIYEPSPSAEYTVDILCDKLTVRLARTAVNLNHKLTFWFVYEGLDNSRDPGHFWEIVYHPDWLIGTARRVTYQNVINAFLLCANEDSLSNVFAFKRLGETLGLYGSVEAWTRQLNKAVRIGSCVRDHHAGQYWYGLRKFTVEK
jgi:hypothetical protein